MPDGQPCEVAVRHTTNIAFGRLQSRFRQLGDFHPQKIRQRHRIHREPAAREASGATTHEYRVHDRGAGAIDVDRRPHFGGTGQGRRTGESGIKNRNGQRHIGVQLVVVISEGQGASVT